jgi:acyl-[acyl carrier protein]--UDP-N-acetylglucosamine O-acyltransferase
MICVVCLSLYNRDVEAVTVIQGNACCRAHINIIGLSRAASERIRRYDDEQESR